MNHSTLLFITLIALSCQTKSPDNLEEKTPTYQIAYNVSMNEEGNNYDVWRMNLDGSEKRNLTEYQDVAWTYLASKDKIFFISDRDTCYRCFYLYEMKPDGSALRKITNFRLRDSWMGARKDGTELIVNPHSTVDSAFYIINLAGEVLHRVETGLVYNTDPCFSPNGQQIVFVGANKKSKREEGFAAELYRIHEDGSDLQKLTEYPPADTTAPWYAYKAGPPRWNAKHNFISYQSFQNGKYSLYAVTPDGSQQWKLTQNDEEEGWHDWSSDGNWLAIELFKADQNQFHIGLMNWANKEMEILTDTLFAYQQAPVFVEVNEGPPNN